MAKFQLSAAAQCTKRGVAKFQSSLATAQCTKRGVAKFQSSLATAQCTKGLSYGMFFIFGKSPDEVMYLKWVRRT